MTEVPELPKIEVTEITDPLTKAALEGAGKITPDRRVLVVGVSGGLDRSVTAELMRRELERLKPCQGDIIIIDDVEKRGDTPLLEQLIKDMPNIGEERKPFAGFIDDLRANGVKEIVDEAMPASVGEAFDPRIRHDRKPDLKKLNARQLVRLYKRRHWFKDDVEAELRARGMLPKVAVSEV